MRARGVRNVVQRLGLAGVFGAGLVALGASCGGATAGTPVVGSESHFLTRCSESCGGGFECIGGLCTKSCLTGADNCSELYGSAICTNQSVEPGQVAVCDVPCSGGDACAGLGSGFACDDSFCREPADSSLEVPDSSATCEPFLDDSPPPVVRGVTVTNTSDATLYVQPYRPGCDSRDSPALVRVSTVGPSDSGEELNIYGAGCLPICQTVMENGWDGTSGPYCSQRDCSAEKPLSWVPLQPGQSTFEPVRLEYVAQQLPRSCADRIVGETLVCAARRIPADGAYMIAVTVSPSATCGETPGCIGQVFSRPVGNYFTQDHTLEISAPAQ